MYVAKQEILLDLLNNTKSTNLITVSTNKTTNNQVLTDCQCFDNSAKIKSDQDL